jgi:hypothetical protein
MDLSFSRMQQRDAAAGNYSAGEMPSGLVDLSFLLAASSAWQAASPTARAVAAIRRDRDGASDRLKALMRIFAPRHGMKASASSLAGSFNRLIFEHLMVGQGR